MARKSSAISAERAAQVQRLLRPILWAVAAGLWFMLALALASYHSADYPGDAMAPYNTHVHNWAGAVGAYLAYQLYLMIGPGVWIMLLGAGVFLLSLAAGKPWSQPVLRATGLVIMALDASCLVALIAPRITNASEPTGGLIAAFLTTQLWERFNTLGTMLILAVFFWIGAILAMDQWVLLGARWLGRTALFFTHIRWPRPVLVGILGGSSAPAYVSLRSGTAGTSRPLNSQAERESDEVPAEVDSDRTGDDNESSFANDEAAAQSVSTSQVPPHDAPATYVTEKRQLSVEELRRKIRLLPIHIPTPVRKSPPGPVQINLSGYRFPGLDLLAEPESNFTQEMERLVRDQAVVLEEALQQYRIDGEVVGIHSGPVITLFELKLAPGTKVSSVSAVSSDLARALKVQNIRVVPNTAGKDTIGIEVPNLKKEKVRLKDLMLSNPDTATRMKLPMFLGKDASGNPLIADLTEMPHMLIAGTTGSGKSVCMNAIIMSFMFTKRPDELRMVLVDPKMVELSMFKDIPHLMCPVVTEMFKAAAILAWATEKMDERYEILAEAGVRDIAGYNSLSWDQIKERFKPADDEEEAVIPKKLPYIVIIIDELADLILTNKEVEGHIVRLAQKARAVGIHLILATQRPQANVVTGLIKGNMPCRISFKVASGLDSRIVLDQKGAELLLGQGDMLYLSPRSTKLVRAQGTLVDDDEIRRVVAYLKTAAQQNFEPQLVQLRSGDPLNASDEERDPLFEDAVRIVLESKRGSVSLIQRRLNIGYSRASRLIEQMAQAGILGEYKGSQAREVIMTVQEWEALKAQMEADARADEETTRQDSVACPAFDGTHRR